MMRYKPTDITVLSGEKELRISWKDGHTSRYPFGGLRKNCPCVFCQGGHGEMGKPMDPAQFLIDTPERLKLNNLKPSGNYALHMFWSDGHSTGIYRYEYLRDGCPVDAGILAPATDADS
ncbi:MAG: DUF971 domain-containing protein [Candidatus Cyclonatronum sp.]|uniref:DUF971 domain-containing protein n=1 Tax=Cyclonatronum sp. TaxID=3024185 RepID=UPI0025BF0CCE|nr:DUF971 domain-containing protein [Cyclonatronum sp.]MCC5933119.1 DUF971 domain-containing protein [Balneolales bacterium]MCH8486678.1 DUF971 domain-containing protein [Cyclonatronum sp.]